MFIGNIYGGDCFHKKNKCYGFNKTVLNTRCLAIIWKF